MATTLPRITVTLTVKQHRVLKAISSASGFSMSELLRDLVDASTPVLEQTAIALQKVKNATDAQKAEMAKVIEASQAKYEPILAAGIDQLDMFFGQVVSVGGGSGVTPSACKDVGGITGSVSKPSNKRKSKKRIPA